MQKEFQSTFLYLHFQNQYSAQYFDLNQIRDKQVRHPMMYPHYSQWIEQMISLDITKDDMIVCYDDQGIIGASRCFWLMKLYDVQNICVLNGGFQQWKQQNGQIENCKPIQPYKTRSNEEYMKFNFKHSLICKFKQINKVSNAICSKQIQEGLFILDSRHPNAFNGQLKEIQFYFILDRTENFYDGNIKGSKNIYFNDLFIPNTQLLKSNQELIELYKQNGINQNDTIYNTCRLGMTACVHFLIQSILNFQNSSVYNGSWLDYGSQPKNCTC